jgi:hypothetical protein
LRAQNVVCRSAERKRSAIEERPGCAGIAIAWLANASGIKDASGARFEHNVGSVWHEPAGCERCAIGKLPQQRHVRVSNCAEWSLLRLEVACRDFSGANVLPDGVARRPVAQLDVIE